MAEAKEEPKQQKKTVHAYKLSAKLDDGKFVIWVSDKVTETRFEKSYTSGELDNKDLKTVFECVKKAVASKPPTWAATYPQEEGGSLFIEVEEDSLDFELPPATFDKNDLF
eukprot:185965_1